MTQKQSANFITAKASLACRLLTWLKTIHETQSLANSVGESLAAGTLAPDQVQSGGKPGQRFHF